MRSGHSYCCHGTGYVFMWMSCASVTQTHAPVTCIEIIKDADMSVRESLCYLGEKLDLCHSYLPV